MSTQYMYSVTVNVLACTNNKWRPAAQADADHTSIYPFHNLLLSGLIGYLIMQNMLPAVFSANYIDVYEKLMVAETLRYTKL
jgi:hypothetical protein